MRSPCAARRRSASPPPGAWCSRRARSRPPIGARCARPHDSSPRCSGSMPRARPRSTWRGRWRACARALARADGDWRARRSSAKRRRSTARTSPPIATWARSARRLIAPGSGVLTHCNTGSLATAGFGTALGVIRAGVAQGRIDQVFAGETRPWLQGARLTVWELQQDGIDATLIADSAGVAPDEDRQGAVGGRRRRPHLRQRRHRQQDRHLPAARSPRATTASRFMVVAPSSTVDMATASGDLIHIEERDAGRTACASAAPARWPKASPPGTRCSTSRPHDLIDAIVTEQGVIEHPDAASMQAAFGA